MPAAFFLREKTVLQKNDSVIALCNKSVIFDC